MLRKNMEQNVLIYPVWFHHKSVLCFVVTGVTDQQTQGKGQISLSSPLPPSPSQNTGAAVVATAELDSNNTCQTKLPAAQIVPCGYIHPRDPDGTKTQSHGCPCLPYDAGTQQSNMGQEVLSQQVVWMKPSTTHWRNCFEQFGGKAAICSWTPQSWVPRSINYQVPETQLQSKCSCQEGAEISQKMKKCQDYMTLILFYSLSLSLSNKGLYGNKSAY